MTTKQRVESYILKHPAATNAEVGAACDTTTRSVATYRSLMRQSGLIPKKEKGWRRKEPVVKAPVAATKTISPVEEIKDQLYAMLRTKKTYTVLELADHFNVGPSMIHQALKELDDGGVSLLKHDHVIAISNSIPKAAPIRLDVKKMTTGMYKFGAIGDNHMCSMYERLDVLNAMYDEYERQGISVVYNTGNWIDGEKRFNKHDLHTHGFQRQLSYFLENYPSRKGITTHFIVGDDHEGWYFQDQGIDVGRVAQMQAEEMGRKDLRYLGYMEADIELPAKNGKTIIRVVHPGGGSAYATSYTMQKLVESYQGGEKPHVVLAGHYHKAEYLFYRGVHIIQTGCTQDQTPFMRKKKLSAHLGGWIVEMGTDDNGAITRFRQEFFPFYDNHYYQQWAHKK